MKITQYEDHELAGIFPLMGETDLAELAEDMEANGQREPIWLFEGRILDGRNRFRACLLKDMDPRIQEYKGKEPLGFVVSMNLKRRHLTESQRAMVAARIATIGHGGDRRSDQAANLPLDPPSQQEAATQFQVSERLIRNAKQVQDKGTPELAATVDAGDVSVSAAAQVAQLPEDEQKEVVAKGPKAVRKRASESRKSKPKKPKLTEGTPSDPCEAFVSRVNQLCASLDAAKKVTKELVATPVYGTHIHAESVVASIEAARKALWQSRPTESCNCVAGGKQPAPECKACFGSGKTTAARVLKRRA